MNHSLDQLEALFARARELPGPERAAFLERACGDDTALRTRLEALLRADSEAGDLLEPAAAAGLAEFPSAIPMEESAGTAIGRYVLLEQIGEGGGGVVYRAEQTGALRQTVALKIVKLGMDTRDVIARFEAERQTLALMDHPNIARVFDAGATETGRPFFVMEFVHGVRITDYCDRHRSSVRERLHLFVQVCHALQHAHHKGIIHRDIKPSNILVAVHDGAAVPKVIDFGIAKATQGPRHPRALLTAMEQFVGTPAYMSPEQADARERDIDTRSDLYSLGMLLYALLTGATPFDTPQLTAAGLDELRRQIREVDPPRPSAELRRLAPEQLAARSAACGTTPAELIRAVAGDLDWIVLRCLEKDRRRRYQSAVELAADVRRHLAHEPVEACPPTWTYVLRKFARRHRPAVIAGASVVAVLLATTAVSMRLALVARQAEQRATSEAASAREVIAFLQNDLLAPPLAEQTPLWDLRLRTVLDRANQSLDERLARQPVVEASLRETLAAAYHTLGEYGTEQRHLERALALRRQLGAGEAPATLEVMARLATNHWAQGHYADGEQLARATIGLQQRVLGAEHPATLRSRHQLASTLWSAGRLAEAVALHRDVFEVRARVLGAEHPDTLASMQDLAQAYRGYGQLDGANFWGRRTLEAKRRVLGPDHPGTLGAMNSLAMTHRARGLLPEAEQLHQETLTLRTRLLGPEHPDTLASMTNLAVVFQEQDRLAEAEQLATRTLEIKRRTLPPDHPSSLNSLSVLAIIFEHEHRWNEAAAMHGNLHEIRQRVLGPGHPDTLTSAEHLALSLQALGRLDEAATLLTTTLALRRERLRPGHPDTLRTTEELAGVRLRQGRFAEAAEGLQSVFAARDQTEPRSWRTAATRSALGEALAGLQRFAEAEAFLHSGFNGLQAPADTLPPANRDLLRTAAARLQRCYESWGKPDQAENWRRRLAELPAAR